MNHRILRPLPTPHPSPETSRPHYPLQPTPSSSSGSLRPITSNAPRKTLHTSWTEPRPPSCDRRRPLPPIPSTSSTSSLQLTTPLGLRPLPPTPTCIAPASAAPRLGTSSSAEDYCTFADTQSESSECSLFQDEPPSLAILEHMRRMKLRRHLGESIPPELVYSSREGSIEINPWRGPSGGSSEGSDSEESDVDELWTVYRDSTQPLSLESTKQRQLWKLRRQLGQSVPSELVYGHDGAALKKHLVDAFGTTKGVRGEIFDLWKEDSDFCEGEDSSENGSEEYGAHASSEKKRTEVSPQHMVHPRLTGGWVREKTARCWRK